jgi:nicotinate-nucleotide pyrophosphorylase
LLPPVSPRFPYAAGRYEPGLGRITRETAPAVAATGVDLISCGWITHSAPILALGLDIAD